MAETREWARGVCAGINPTGAEYVRAEESGKCERIISLLSWYLTHHSAPHTPGLSVVPPVLAHLRLINLLFRAYAGPRAPNAHHCVTHREQPERSLCV